MKDSARFQLNSPHIADEEIQGEVIVINLASGNYYSLLNAAADVWQLLKTGAALGDITRLIQARYDGDAAQMQESIAKFVADLEREGLMIPATEPPPPLDRPLLPETPRRPFEPPALNVYIDMQKMLLLDPIHEVDETGWPSTNATPKQNP